MKKQGNGNVARSEESMTRMTSYRFPHHGNRSFTFVQDDALPYPVIQSGSKNAVWENRETAMSYGTKNLLLWWHLTVSLTTVTDSLLSLWATSFGLRHHDVFCSPLIMTRFPKIVILNRSKNTVVERQETGWWHGVKNLLPWWRLNVLYKDHIVKEYLAISWQLTADSFYQPIKDR